MFLRNHQFLSRIRELFTVNYQDSLQQLIKKDRRMSILHFLYMPREEATSSSPALLTLILVTHGDWLSR